MNSVFKTTFAATLLTLAAALYSVAAQAAAELKASASEVTVGETIQIDASSGSSMIPVYAKDWNVSPEFSLISAGRSGAKIKALTAGVGTVSANVNLKDLSIGIKIVAAKPAAAVPVAPIAPVQEVTAAPPARKLNACQQEMVERKREIAQDLNEGYYDKARTKLLDLKKSWQEDSRWADAMLGAIEKLSPEAALPAMR